MLRGVGHNVSDDAHRGVGRVDEGVAHHELLEDVVLDRAAELGLRGALLLGGDDVHAQHRQHGAVHGHRDRDLVQGDRVEEDLHVLDGIDRHAGHADVALDARVVRVVAAMRREIERDREAHLAGGEVGAVEAIAVLGRAEAGVLANGPRLVGVHGGVRAASEGIDARHLVGLLALAVLLGVQRLDRDALASGIRVSSPTRGATTNEQDTADVADQHVLMTSTRAARRPWRRSPWRREAPSERPMEPTTTTMTILLLRMSSFATAYSTPLPRGVLAVVPRIVISVSIATLAMDGIDSTTRAAMAKAHLSHDESRCSPHDAKLSSLAPSCTPITSNPTIDTTPPWRCPSEFACLPAEHHLQQISSAACCVARESVKCNDNPRVFAIYAVDQRRAPTRGTLTCIIPRREDELTVRGGSYTRYG